MEYTKYFLLIMGLLGVLTHLLMKISKVNKRTGGNFKFRPFIQLEWPSILLSIVVVLAAFIARNEIKELKEAGRWLALGFYTMGLAAQSFIYFLIGRAEKLTGASNDELLKSSFVEDDRDFVQYPSNDDFPVPGAANTVYLDATTDICYVWDAGHSTYKIEGDRPTKPPRIP